MDDYLQFCLRHELLSAPPENNASTSSWLWFIFYQDKLAVQESRAGDLTIIRTGSMKTGLAVDNIKTMGRYLDSNCILAKLTDPSSLREGISLVPLRALLGKINQDHFTIAGRGLQILHFHSEHKFCGKCGTLTQDSSKELARTCPDCGHTNFPRVSPAVIMSVIRNDKILLGRSPHFPPGMYSTLAGFVEPGETLEEAVKREVFEEVGLEVDTIQYNGSQPWPFPHSMMIGFSANYLRGEIVIDHNELEDANWFSINDLPPLPRKGTIARHLIDKYIREYHQDE